MSIFHRGFANSPEIQKNREIFEQAGLKCSNPCLKPKPIQLEGVGAGRTSEGSMPNYTRDISHRVKSSGSKRGESMLTEQVMPTHRRVDRSSGKKSKNTTT